MSKSLRQKRLPSIKWNTGSGVVYIHRGVYVITTHAPVTAEQLASVHKLVGTHISRCTADLLQKRGYVLTVSEDIRGGAFMTLRGVYHPAGVV